MTEEQKLYTDLQEVVQRHDKDVAELFTKYGIEAEADLENILNATAAMFNLHGDDRFLEDLFIILHPGLETKGFQLDVSDDSLDSFAGWLGAISNIKGAIKDAGTVKNAAVNTVKGDKPPAQSDKKKILGLPVPLFALAVLAVIILIIFFIKQAQS